MLLREILDREPMTADINSRRADFDEYMATKQSEPTLDAKTREFIASYFELRNEYPVVNIYTDMLLNAGKTPNLQHVGEMLPRAFVAIMLNHDPEHLYATGDVTPAFHIAQHSTDAQLGLQLSRNRLIQSNVADREWLLSWSLQAHGLTDERPIVEYGTSSQAIGKKITEIALGNLKHHEVEMVQKQRTRKSNRPVGNVALTELMAEVANQPLPHLPQWRGLDLFQPSDPAVSNWVRACSQYLEDWTNPEKREAFDYIHNLKHPNVTWAYADFSKFTLGTYRELFPNDLLPKAIYIPFSIYELGSEAERKKTLDQAVEIINTTDAAYGEQPDGIVVVLDDIQSIEPDNSIKIINRRRDFTTCGGWVYSARIPEAGFQKYFSFENGRLTRAIPESGLAVFSLLSANFRNG